MAQDTGTVDTKDPKVDQVTVEPVNTAPAKTTESPKEPTNTEPAAEFAGASGVDGSANKKKLDADQPAFRPNPTDAAEAEKEENKGPDLSAAELSSLPQEPEKPQDGQPKKEGPDLKFTSDEPVIGISEENMKKINEHWGLAQISPELSETLQNCVIKPNKETGGLSFKLANNHTIQWVPEYAGIQGFVGIVGRSKLDDLDAKMVIATLASQGKKEVTLYGDRESKEKMWLEAMRQGLGVTNFKPLPSDDPNSVYQQWLREAPDSISGASVTPEAPEQKSENNLDSETPAQEAAAETPTSEDNAPADVKADEPKAEDSKPEEAKADTKNPEEPKEETPKATQPEEPKAEENKPAEVKAEEPKDEPGTEDKKPEEVQSEAATPADADVKTEAKAEEKAEEKPSIAASTFAKKADEGAPEAKEEAKVETPVTDKPAEEKPAVKDAAKSSFIGDKTDKKDEAPTPTPPPAPKNETLEETLDRRIKQTKNPEVEAALKTLRAEYKSGTLQLDSIDKEIVQKKLGGNGGLTVSKVNQAINHVATKPENKGIVLPTVSEQKPQQQTPRQKATPGSKGP